MNSSNLPCLSLAITPLAAHADAHWAFWVTQAPESSGQVHHDRFWPQALTNIWREWQELFSSHPPIDIAGKAVPFDLPQLQPTLPGQSGYLMQTLGLGLCQWLFDASIDRALRQSEGVAIGQGRVLRIRLDLQDDRLTPLPWEIMQPQIGKPALGVNRQILLSRTSRDVDALIPLKLSQSLNILLVLGDAQDTPLDLTGEAHLLQQTLLENISAAATVTGTVKTLVKPSRQEFLTALEEGDYNLFFYAGHGQTAPTGGRIFLQGQETLTGTELAQALVNHRVTLAVFNSCLGAQLQAITPEESPQSQPRMLVPGSSLAKTLLHHGVPAVLGMRDAIADPEALNFIGRFLQALSDRYLIDEAVTLARQHLLSLYGFNQPAWTLPILYMHPAFQGEILTTSQIQTEIPTNIPFLEDPFPKAELRLKNQPQQVWPIEGGLIRVGRRAENDVVVSEQWVSQRHAEIICRSTEQDDQPTYFLKDFSRFGTLVCQDNQWQRIHHREVSLASGTMLRFGSAQGEILEFFVQS